jgi:hypothetical protein
MEIVAEIITEIVEEIIMKLIYFKNRGNNYGKNRRNIMEIMEIIVEINGDTIVCQWTSTKYNRGNHRFILELS